MGEEWLQWWTRAGGASVTRPAPGDTIRREPAAGSASDPIDAQKLAALNETYARRWEALWSAAAGAVAPGESPPRPIPAIAHVAPGDRRFAAREWNELPYFALIKQGYLLGERVLRPAQVRIAR